MLFDLNLIQKTYKEMPSKIDAARTALGRPLTLAEKILYSHLWKGVEISDFERGKAYVDFAPDRVAMQDATAQMALLQFDTTGRKQVSVPSTVHCDHLIVAKNESKVDLKKAIN